MLIANLDYSETWDVSHWGNCLRQNQGRRPGRVHPRGRHKETGKITAIYHFEDEAHEIPGPTRATSLRAGFEGHSSARPFTDSRPHAAAIRAG